MTFLPTDVRNALKRQAPKVLRKGLEKEARKKFNQIKSEMLEEFLVNPVTQEILQGPKGANISGSLGGTSNLFAFIGFNEGEEPIAPILELLRNVSFEYSGQSSGTKLGIKFKVNLPTSEEIFAITPLPWATGRSWAEGIERGLSGLGFLLKKNQGRSGAAVQSRVKVRAGRFQNRPYISSFIRKYKKRFRELT